MWGKKKESKKKPSPGKNVVCGYGHCMLPDKNGQYFCQMVYLALCAFVLVSDKSTLTYFAMIMFIWPIFYDLVFTKLIGSFFQFLRCAFLTVDSVILIFSLLGVKNIVQDTGIGYKLISEMTVLNGFTIPKDYILGAFIVQIVIPVIFFFGSPTSKTKGIVEDVVKQAAASETGGEVPENKTTGIVEEVPGQAAASETGGEVPENKTAGIVDEVPGQAAASETGGEVPV